MRVEVALLRYIVFYCKLGCDTSEPQVSYISKACSSLVRQPYYAPNCIILKISGLETILATEKGRWDGRMFYIDEYTLISSFSRCARCAQKRYCWESVRFASERSRVRSPSSPPKQYNPNLLPIGMGSDLLFLLEKLKTGNEENRRTVDHAKVYLKTKKRTDILQTQAGFKAKSRGNPL